MLLLIVLTVIFTSYLGKSTVTRIDESFASIYKDRLIPANELFHILDLLYQKRLILSEYINGTRTESQTLNKLMSINHSVDSIIHEYEKTYLVDEEDKNLASLKVKMKQYNSMEKEIMLTKSDKEYKLNNHLIPVFEELRSDLIVLSRIQTTVGKELLDDSKQMKASSNFIHYCQLTIILVILLIIQSIIFSARSIIPKKPQNYRLN